MEFFLAFALQESGKELFLFFFGDANACIGYLDLQKLLLVLHHSGNEYRDSAFFGGVLEGIPDEIVENFV